MEFATCKHCSTEKPLTAEFWTYNTRPYGPEFSTWRCRTCWNAYHKERRARKKAEFIGPPKPNGWGMISGIANRSRWAHKRDQLSN